MAQGLLKVLGTVDITQFWNQGESDADTVNVMIGSDAFSFSPTGKEPFHVTHLFDDARVKGTGTNPAVDKGKLKIRLEHLDATELHYEGYRQTFGETATVALHARLAAMQKNPLRCEVRTSIDNPSDPFDTYARLIGSVVIIDEKGKDLLNINDWLLTAGWALPSFYNSASSSEIKHATDLSSTAEKTSAGIWGSLTNQVQEPFLNLKYHRNGEFIPTEDVGPFVIPKFFRRQVAWKHSHPSIPTFAAYLAQTHDDGWVMLDKFLANSHLKPAAKNFSSLVVDGRLTVGPKDLVFYEKASTLINKRGHEIANWDIAAKGRHAA